MAHIRTFAGNVMPVHDPVVVAPICCDQIEFRKEALAQSPHKGLPALLGKTVSQQSTGS